MVHDVLRDFRRTERPHGASERLDKSQDSDREGILTHLPVRNRAGDA